MPISASLSLGWVVMACLLSLGRVAGVGHTGRAHRVCLSFNSGAVDDDKHMNMQPLTFCGSDMHNFHASH